MTPSGPPRPTPDVILVDDEPDLLESGTQALELSGLTVKAFARADEALAGISPASPSVIVSDVRMPGTTGLELLEKVRVEDPDLPVILITGHGDIPMAIQAIRDGAYDFIEKPFVVEELVASVHRAREQRRLVLDNRALRAALQSGSPLENRLVGRSAAMNRLRRRITDFAATEADVLILGETGTGKELVANSLHDLSGRAGGRFVAINCGALPETIIESELFGHEAGAFTGAVKMREGKFEYASGGTVFLDEIESMPLEMQARLLRVLEERSVVRLGSNKPLPVDVRVVAATKEDLKTLAARGTFREDLYYRLNVLNLAIPPLRERREDIPLLFAHFLAKAAARLKRQPVDPSPGELALLTAHDWPGNVRELENTATRFAVGLGVEIAGLGQASTLEGFDVAPLADQLAVLEEIILRRALHEAGGSMKVCYERLGISRKTLYDKLKRYAISTDGMDEPAA